MNLEKAITDYLLQMIENRYAQSTFRRYEQVLNHFQSFINARQILWQDVFTFDTLQTFEKQSGLTHARAPVRGLSRYLFAKNKIHRPIEKPIQTLPQIYEQYLEYYKKTRHIHHFQILTTRNTLLALNEYLERGKINLSNIKIEHVDAFLAERCANYRPATCRNQRSDIRGFLRYLYQERSLLRRDLAAFVVGPVQFARIKPPRFLFARQVKKLFKSLQPSSPRELRACAMVHLAYSLGLRPKEISLTGLDDISFVQAEITIPDRKSQNPFKLPLPENTIKTIAAYIIGGRPKSSRRNLFLSLCAPYGPVSAAAVSQDIKFCMKKADLPASAYHLRHTYAQNLLQSGSAIFDIKQLMGHDRIRTTQRYLHIHTELMRKVLFDETI